MEKMFAQYDFSLAIEIVRDFIWNDFADWYLEIAKVQQKDQNLKQSTDDILLYVLERILVITHPFMPFVTEVIWKEFGTNTLIMVEKWPRVEGFAQENVEKSFDELKELIVAIRNIRSEYKVEPKKFVDLVLVINDSSRALVESHKSVIAVLARVNEGFEIVAEYEPQASDVSFVLKDMSGFLKLEIVVDTEKEKVRTQKEIAELTVYLQTVAEKLSNAEFRSKAPEKVIAQMEQKQKEAQEKLEKLSS
jgi:valyl-tRNA synthetase